MKSVNEVSKLSGVSRRTLQYYDEIGLLPPSKVMDSGYRQYDDEALRRLWCILFYKELDIPLEDIRQLLNSPKDKEKELLLRHKQILLDKQTQLQKMTQSVDRVLNDDFDISMLGEFWKNKIITQQKKYEKEIKTIIEDGFFAPLVKAMKNGVIFNALSPIEKASNMMTIEISKLVALGTEVGEKFRLALSGSPNSLAVQNAVKALREFISIVMPCDEATIRKIGQAYLDYKDELDKKMPLLAEFVYKAIKHIYP